MSETKSEALVRFSSLTARVDAFFLRVQARHGDQLACRPGCDGCCRVSLAVTHIEAAVIKAFLASLEPDRRAALRTQALAAHDRRCAALGPDGHCAVYPARPLVCRSHGVPVKTRDRRGLPVVSACALNFTTLAPGSADPDCVLDQETLSTVLAALEVFYTQENPALDRTQRPALRELLCEPFRTQ